MVAILQFLTFLALWWFCYDDFLAKVVGNPELGHVPWPIWVLIWLGLAGAQFTAKYRDE